MSQQRNKLNELLNVLSRIVFVSIYWEIHPESNKFQFLLMFLSVRCFQTYICLPKLKYSITTAMYGI